MSPRTVTTVVGLAFFLAGIAIVLAPVSTRASTGITITCGNSLGLGFDEVAVARESPAYVEMCTRLRSERLTWAAPVVGFGVLVFVGAAFVGRRRVGTA